MKHILLKRYLKPNSNSPKILIFDIETAPMTAYVWKMWKENVHLDQLISDWFVICWSAKWLGSNEVLGECLTPEEMFKQDDSRIVQTLWKLFDECDILIAHNGKKFDTPRMNARFIINGLRPPSFYRQIDTCEIARKQFGFSSNKLDALATYFGFNHKLDTSFELWEKCMRGDQEALNYMLKYNKQDVILLEQVYIKLRPWIPNHPNINIINSTNNKCNNCGGNLIKLPNKYYYTNCYKYQLYRCSDCGTTIKGEKIKL